MMLPKSWHNPASSTHLTSFSSSLLGYWVCKWSTNFLARCATPRLCWNRLCVAFGYTQWQLPTYEFHISNDFLYKPKFCIKVSMKPWMFDYEYVTCLIFLNRWNWGVSIMAIACGPKWICPCILKIIKFLTSKDIWNSRILKTCIINNFLSLLQLPIIDDGSLWIFS